MSSTVRPTWDLEPEGFTGDIGAGLSVNRDAWSDLGAKFVEIDDELGGKAWIAAGKLDAPNGPLEFGVLDYGGDVTYVLIPATGTRNERLTALLIDAFVEAGVFSRDEVLDERSPFETESSLAQRVALLEQWAGETTTEAASTTMPVAVDVIPCQWAEPANVSLRKMTIGWLEHFHSSGWPNRHIGTVKSFDPDKGLGFISPVEGGREVLLKLEMVVGGTSPGIGEMVMFRYSLEPRKPDEEELERRFSLAEKLRGES